MFLKIEDDLVNMENVLTIKPHTTSITASVKGPSAVQYPAGVIIYFVDGSTSTYSTSMEEVADALDELGVML